MPQALAVGISCSPEITTFILMAHIEIQISRYSFRGNKWHPSILHTCTCAFPIPQSNGLPQWPSPFGMNKSSVKAWCGSKNPCTKRYKIFYCVFTLWSTGECKNLSSFDLFFRFPLLFSPSLPSFFSPISTFLCNIYVLEIRRITRKREGGKRIQIKENGR